MLLVGLGALLTIPLVARIEIDPPGLHEAEQARHCTRATEEGTRGIRHPAHGSGPD
jgi:hypothetical protein